MTNEQGTEYFAGVSDQRGKKAKLTTSIHIPPQTLELLKTAAFRDAQKSGGRFSVSAFLTRFIEKHRGELEGD